MIPQGLLSGRLKKPDGRTIDFSILEVSAQYFTFRLTAEEQVPEQKSEFLLWATELMTKERMEIQLQPTMIRQLEKNRFWTKYRVDVQEKAYAVIINKLTTEYLSFVSDKLELSESELAEKRTGYPSIQEDAFYDDFEKWKEKTFSAICPEADWIKIVQQVPQRALCLQTPDQIERYLKEPIDQFSNTVFHQSYLKNHSDEITINAIELGNQFCRFLLPDETKLRQVWEKGSAEKLQLTLALPPMRPMDMPYFRRMLTVLKDVDAGLSDPELVINDTGSAELACDILSLEWKIRAGVRMDRQELDPREQWSLNKIGMPFLHDADYLLEINRAFRISSFSAVGWKRGNLPNVPLAVYLPYAPVNSGGNCALRALSNYGERGRQVFPRACLCPCLKETVQYPDFLHAVGVFNAVFAVEPEILEKTEVLEPLLEHAEKVVFNLL